MTPGLGQGINVLALPVSSLIIPCSCRVEQDTPYAPDPLTKAPESPLLALGLLVAASLLPTCTVSKSSINISLRHYRIGRFLSTSGAPAKAADVPEKWVQFASWPFSSVLARGHGEVVVPAVSLNGQGIAHPGLTTGTGVPGTAGR